MIKQIENEWPPKSIKFNMFGDFDKIISIEKEFMGKIEEIRIDLYKKIYE